jgi:heat shock protein HtpX
MATLYTQQDKNVGKTWLLMAFMFGLIIAIGWFLSYYYNDRIILLIAVVVSVVMNITGYWFSDKIALSMSKAVPASETQYAELHNIVENLSITAGLPKPRVYIIPDAAPNAFATGRNKEHAAVAVTEGLLHTLDRSELEGVIAHELAHIGNRDILISTIAVVLAGFISLIADFTLRGAFRGGDNNGRSNLFVIVIGIALVILAPLAATIIRMAISRKREFLADATGSLLTRYPEGLARALEKISNYKQPMEHASDATAHMFISNPFGAKAMSGFHKLFATHPPVEERLAALRGLHV